MGKKLFSLCMALVLCLSLLPVTALAADGATVYVVSVELKGSKEKPAYATTNADTGAVTTEGADENNYNIMWDGETLTLRNAAIKQAGVHNNESIAVYLASGNMNLVLVGKNTVEAPDSESVSSCGIHVGGNLTIRGQDNGSLSVSGGDSGGSSYGIHAFDTITINSGSVNATSGEAQGDSCGIFAEDEITATKIVSRLTVALLLPRPVMLSGRGGIAAAFGSRVLSPSQVALSTSWAKHPQKRSVAVFTPCNLSTSVVAPLQPQEGLPIRNIAAGFLR